MATSKTARIFANLTVQSYRQRKAISHRLVQHPSIALTLSPQLTSVQTSSDDVHLIPSAARWDEWDSDLAPRNWSLKRKILATALVTQISWLVQFASAIDAGVVEAIEKEFGIRRVVSALATGLFLIGFALGAPVAGPLSEHTGRNPVYTISLILFLLTTLLAALTPSLTLFLIARFLSGFFGGAGLVCAGGTTADLWSPRDQLIALPLYAAGGISGLAAGPAAGGVMLQSVGGEFVKITEWATLVTGVLVLIGVLIAQPETYEPVLLKWKTDLVVDAMKPEERELAFPATASPRWTLKVRARHLLTKTIDAFTRPIVLSLHEPVILLLSLNLALLYGILFTLLPGYVPVFTDTYSFTTFLRGLTFYGLAVGFLLALAWALVLARHYRQRNPVPELPGFDAETRMVYAMVGAPTIPVALFWMAWTARSDISPWSPIMATVLLGFGVLCVFFSSYMYIIHAYGRYAASGLVFITLVRYVLAGGMVIAGVAMFERLGVSRTLSALGILSTLLCPLPYVLFAYGQRLRRGSALSAAGGRSQ